jgi:hypothetical protein
MPSPQSLNFQGATRCANKIYTQRLKLFTDRNSLFHNFRVQLVFERGNGVNRVFLQERSGIYQHLSVKGDDCNLKLAIVG